MGKAERAPILRAVRSEAGAVVDERPAVRARSWLRGVLCGACLAVLAGYAGWEWRDRVARDEAAELRKRIGALDVELKDVRRVLGMISHGREHGTSQQDQEERR